MKSFLAFFLILAACGCACRSHSEFPRKSDKAVVPESTPIGADPTYVTIREPVWIDRAFTPGELSSILSALHDWNVALNGYLRFEVISADYTPGDKEVEGRINNILDGTVIYRTSPLMADLEGLSANVLAWTDDDRVGVHMIADRIGDFRNFHNVVLHELGHTLGLGHTMVGDSLMYPTAERQPDCVDRLTILLLAGKRGWDFHFMRGCAHPI